MGKNRKTSKGDFDRGLMSKFYGPGADAQHMLKRYDVEGYRGGGRAMEMTGKSYRGVDEVRKDLAKAMMGDYHTQHQIQTAAQLGNKNAKKFAKKGIKGGNISEAYDVLRDLKKEYVGGGGMDGAKNISGLTYALMSADRKKLLEDMKPGEETTPDVAKPPPEPQFLISPEEEAALDSERDERIKEYEANRASGGLFGTDEGTDEGSDYLNKYKFNVAKGLRNAGVETRGPEAPLFIL